MDKIVITAALCGGATRKEQNPNVPYTTEEYVREAKRAEEAGAAVIHIHIRDPQTGWQTGDPKIVAEVVEAVRANTTALLNLSTGGMGPDVTLENRKRGIELFAPELASLNPGTMNFCLVNHKDGRVLFDGTYMNPFETTIEYGRIMKQKGIKPELECFDIGHVHNALFFAGHYDFLETPLHFSFVFGVAGGVRFNSDMVNSFLHAIPPGATWQGIGVGIYCFPVVMASAIFGGHIRVGLEDNIYIDPATKTPSRGNWDQVEKAARIAREVGFEPATPEEARKIFNLPERQQA